MRTITCDQCKKVIENHADSFVVGIRFGHNLSGMAQIKVSRFVSHGQSPGYDELRDQDWCPDCLSKIGLRVSANPPEEPKDFATLLRDYIDSSVEDAVEELQS